MRRLGPAGAMGLSVCLLAFLGGVFVSEYRVFPYQYIRSAWLTGESLVAVAKRELGIFPAAELTGYLGLSPIPAGEAADARWTILDTEAPRLPTIALGALNLYGELCPDTGCLAVAYDTGGNVAGTWPYRPGDIYAADITGGAYPHETLAFDPRVDVHPVGMKMYADGDFLVTFQAAAGRSFPYGMGVARVGPEGAPRWTRFDYSHHWPALDGGGTAYVPGIRIGGRPRSWPIQPRHLERRCSAGHYMFDTIQIIDGSGRLIEEIELMPLFLRSHYSELLRLSTNRCDPLHLNHIDIIRADAGPDLNAGDLVLSFRNLSRFAVFDPRARRIKRLVGGGFVQQHSVRFLSGSKFLVLDNLGGDPLGPPSRIVELDLATGEERRIFPNADTPEPYTEVFSRKWGYLDLSPNRNRMLASFAETGRAYEVDIASGRLLAVYDNIHDLSLAPGAPEEYSVRAGRFHMQTMLYDPRQDPRK